MKNILLLIAFCCLPLVCFASGGIDPLLAVGAFGVVIICVALNFWSMLGSRKKYKVIITGTIDFIWSLVWMYAVCYDFLEYRKYSIPGALPDWYISRYPQEDISSDLSFCSFFAVIFVSLFLYNALLFRKIRKVKRAAINVPEL